ncbi:MAG TPA: amino acid permease, partial [Desulfonauticus sp.]|nr:amino acid permease [Desulfonauticus sp.]
MDMENPGKQFPLAIALGALVSLFLYILGSIPIAAILPYEKIDLTKAIFLTFEAIIKDIWHLDWLLKLLSLFVAFGVMGGVFAWIASPSRGLLATAEAGELPPILQKTNKKEMPVPILIIQGIIVTIISSLYFFMKHVEVGFFLISAMTISLYLIMYMLMYASVIKLRYTQPHLPRPFKLPGGKLGLWLIAGTGFVAMLFSFVVAFFPPSQLPVGSPLF